MSVEKVLELDYLQKHLEYINYVRGTYNTNFLNRLKELNKTRKKPNTLNLCEYIFSQGMLECDKTTEKSVELKKLYHKLMLKHHPDKQGAESDDETYNKSKLLTIYINEKYLNSDIEALKNIELLGEKYIKDHDIILKIEQYKKDIEIATNTVPWRWQTGSPSMKVHIEDEYVSEEEYDNLMNIEKEIINRYLNNYINFIRTENETLIFANNILGEKYNKLSYQSIDWSIKDCESILKNHTFLGEKSYTKYIVTSSFIREQNFDISQLLHYEKRLALIALLLKMESYLEDIKLLGTKNKSEELFDFSKYQDFSIEIANLLETSISNDDYKHYSTLLTSYNKILFDLYLTCRY